MLVLSRKTQEVVNIGGEIVLTVLEVKGNRVKLGIQAPRETPVVRGELSDRAGEASQEIARTFTRTGAHS